MRFSQLVAEFHLISGRTAEKIYRRCVQIHILVELVWHADSLIERQNSSVFVLEGKFFFRYLLEKILKSDVFTKL